MSVTNANIDEREIERFNEAAPNWWDRTGEFKALHDINPVRLAFVQAQVNLAGKRVLDVGCGGGLISEGLASAGARVTAIDMSERALDVARDHLTQSGLTVDYRLNTIEAMALEQPGIFDAVTCMELVEHVPDPVSIVEASSQAVKPGGHVFFATVNRTWLSLVLVIWASEYVFRIIRRGTHQYRRLVRPSELEGWGRSCGLKLSHISGLRYIPFLRMASLCHSTRMNYLVSFTKTQGPTIFK